MFTGAPPLHIGELDVYKTLKVAGYVALSAFFVAVAQIISGIDFSNLDLYGINGQVIANGAVNILLYLGERFTKDTSKKTEE